MSDKFEIQSLPLRQIGEPPEYCDANTCHELWQRVAHLEKVLDYNIPILYKKIMSAQKRADDNITQIVSELINPTPEGQPKKAISLIHYGGSSKRRTLKSKRR